MNVKPELFDVVVLGELANFVFKHFGEEQTRLNGAGSTACGAGFLNVDVGGRAYSLAGDLHESEFRKWQDVVARTVVLHVLAHALIEFLPVFWLIHVDEVNYNDASHVAQSQLSGQLVGCSEVNVECIYFLSFGRSRAVAAIDVYHVECFGMFNDEICSALIGDDASKRLFHLACDAKVVEDGQVALVELHNVVALRCYELNIVAQFFKHVFVVNIDVLIRS